jgi:hypothetical protein
MGNRNLNKRLVPLVTGAVLPATQALAVAMPRPALFFVDGAQGRCLIGANGIPEALFGGLDAIQAPGTIAVPSNGSWIGSFSAADSGAHVATFAGVALDGLGNPSPGSVVQLTVCEAANAAITVGGIVGADSFNFAGYIAGPAANGAVLCIKSAAVTGAFGFTLTLGAAGTFKYLLRYRHVALFGTIGVA